MVDEKDEVLSLPYIHAIFSYMRLLAYPVPNPVASGVAEIAARARRAMLRYSGLPLMSDPRGVAIRSNIEVFSDVFHGGFSAVEAPCCVTHLP